MTYHIVYQTTNLINNKIYIGVHCTNDLNDGYLGSGKHLKCSIEKYGEENFKREILFQFKTQKEAYEKEKELVNEAFVKRNDTYNMRIGGKGGSKNMVNVKDKDGNKFSVFIDDPRWLSGELVGVHAGTKHTEEAKKKRSIASKGKVAVKDKEENYFKVDKNDPRYLRGELVGVTKGTVPVKDKDGNTLRVSKDDPRYLSGKLIHHCKGKKHSDETKKKMSLSQEGYLIVIDKKGNKFQVSKDDPRWLSGELISTSKGSVTVKDKDGNKFRVSKDDPRYLSGELISIFKGRVFISKNGEIKRVYKEELKSYLDNGWVRGRVSKKD